MQASHKTFEHYAIDLQSISALSLASGIRLIIFCGNTLEVFQAEDTFELDYAANVLYRYYGLDGILWESDHK